MTKQMSRTVKSQSVALLPVTMQNTIVHKPSRWWMVPDVYLLAMSPCLQGAIHLIIWEIARALAAKMVSRDLGFYWLEVLEHLLNNHQVANFRIYNALRSWRFISLTVPVSFFCLIAEHKSNLPRFTFENRPSKAHQKDYKELHLVPKLSWNILKPGWWHWLNYFLFTRPKIGSKTSAIWGWFPRYISR